MEKLTNGVNPWIVEAIMTIGIVIVLAIIVGTCAFITNKEPGSVEAKLAEEVEVIAEEAIESELKLPHGSLHLEDISK